jgi:uncharacterized membrane protein YczE
MNVFFEAILVGLFLIPVFWATEKLGLGKWVTVFLAGVYFHLLAEITGINKAYVMTKK